MNLGRYTQLCIVALGGILASCGGNGSDDGNQTTTQGGSADTAMPSSDTAMATKSTPGKTGGPAKVVADLKATNGNQAHGSVTFSELDTGDVRITGQIDGLKPGQHGFHIHETGDCSAPDASSAGGHYAPNGHPHGSPEAPADQRHAGDLGNVKADADGRAIIAKTADNLKLSGPDSIAGRAVIVHANADDLESQPSGDAGPRVACGRIAAADASER